MANRLSKEDIRDLDIVDANELASDGFDPFLTLPLVSISAGGIFTVNVSSLVIGIIHEPGGTVEPGDRLYLQGATPAEADGYYTIDSLLTDSTLTVEEATVAATGGNLFFIYPSGAGKVGVDTTGCTHTDAHDVQEAIEDLDAAITDGYGITEEEHKTLRQLIHLADGVGGPLDGFTTGAYREILPSADPFPTSIIWWESSAKSKKIVEKTITRNPNKTPSTIEWKAYATDGITVVATVSDAINYSGVFELDRTRTIS